MKFDFSKYLRLWYASRRVLSSSKYVLFINILDRLFSFLFFLLIAREFSPESYGEVVTLFALSTVCITFFDLGLPIYVQRQLSLSRYDAPGLFSSLFFLNLFIIVPYSIFLFSAYKILYPEISLLVFIIIALIMFESSLTNLCNKALSGINEFRSQFITLLISRIYTILFTVLGIFYFKFDLVSVISVMLAGFFLHLISVLFILDRRGEALSLTHINLKKYIAIIKLSIPLGLAVIFNFLYDKIDILIISGILDFSKTAFYNVGYGIYKTSALSFSFLLVTGFTRVSYLSSNKKAVSLFFVKYLRLILMICVPVSVMIFLLSGYLIQVLYSDRFFDSIIILKILSAGIVAMGCNNLTGIVLNGIGLFKVVMYITMFGLIINVILNFAFIPIYGINAAAWTTVITEYLIFFLELYYLMKVLKLNKTNVLNS